MRNAILKVTMLTMCSVLLMGGMFTSSVERPSASVNRTYFRKNIENTTLTTTPTVIHTVTSGSSYYLINLVASCVNGTNTIGRWRLEDSGTVIMPFMLNEKTVGAPSAAQIVPPPFVEPVKFTTNVQVTEQAGDVSCSITIVGYEEVN